jgi:hypothetical protein
MMRNLCFLIVSLLLCDAALGASPEATIVEVKPIWDAAPHNAFTDLARWNGSFWCAFREGRAHVSADGKIRVLTSADGADWESAALVAHDDYDLRDAGLSTTPEGRLMLIGGAAPRKEDNQRAPTGSFVSFSRDGSTWTEPKIVVEPGRWLWRVTWHGDTAYGVSYATPEGRPYTALLTSDDGQKFRALVPQLFGEGYPTEATLRFEDDGTMLCLQRRDGEPDARSAYLGIAEPPCTDWQWHDLGIYFGGPNFIQIPSGHWIAAGRIFRDEGPKTELAHLDVQNKTLTPIVELKSGGDNSYPGLVWHDDTLWVSYYSSHEGKAKIYLAKVKID